MRGQSKECCRCVDLINALKRFSHEEPETSNLTSEARKKFIDEIHECVENIEKNQRPPSTSTSTRPKIQKVPAFLRQRDQQKFEKYYEPRWISIGPIHHGKPNLQVAEKYKLKWTAKFIANNQLKTKRVCREIENNMKELKECFDEQVIKNYDDGTLSLMLFMDGCSILLLMQHCSTNKPKDLEEINLKDDQAVLVKQDLFLLENQIPFRVLNLVMDLLTDSSEIESSMGKFIGTSMNIMVPPVREENNKDKNRSESNPIHLLDLLRLSLVSPKDPINFTRSSSSSATDPNAENQPINQRRDNFTRSFSSSSATELSHLKELTTNNEPTLTDQSLESPHPKQSQDIMHVPVLPMEVEVASLSEVIIQKPALPMKRRSHPTQSQDIMHANQRSFRGAGELKKAGIYFQRSEERYLGAAVKFIIPKYCISGRLELPQLIVDDSMAPKFLNLIAYEMCPDVKTNYEVSAYIGFLDRLIDYPNDVKELRKSRVLLNDLGSDEEVADLFNEISTDLVINAEIYKNVRQNIEQHYNSKKRTWMAQVYHDHFSSPWTIVAFLAALAVLVMTIIQTWRAFL